MKRTNALPVRLLAAAIAVAASLAFAPSPASAQGAGSNRPFVGVWKLNIGKSHAHVPPGFALYRQFRDGGDGWMFHTVITITPRGTYFLFAAARYDGKPYPDYTARSLGNLVRHATKPPRTVTFTRINAHRIRWTDRVHGRVVAGGTETVSPDGKTLTVTDHMPGRAARHAQVFDRVSGPTISPG